MVRMKTSKGNLTNTGYPVLESVRGNILCEVSVYPSPIGPGPLSQYKYVVVEIGSLQLEKTDCHLAV
jgi:hypothetical protein